MFSAVVKMSVMLVPLLALSLISSSSDTVMAIGIIGFVLSASFVAAYAPSLYDSAKADWVRARAK